MAENNLSTLTVKLVADTSNFNKEMKATEEKSQSFSKQFGKVNDAFAELTGVSLTGMGAIAGVGMAFKAVTDEAFESERSMAATEAVIKSTGGAAGMTAEQIADLAGSESLLTALDDDVVQGGENMLLTFTNIGEDVFPRATRTMEDMAAAMAGGDIASVDLKNTAIQLGKALNDPVTGMTALQRVGVTFTAQQKETIKQFMAQNDIAGAQKVILTELEKEFGGMAEAMGNTDAGKIQKATNAIHNMEAEIGSHLIPVLGDAAQAFTDIITMQDQLAAAEKQHASDVEHTAQTYEDYVAELNRAAEAGGFVVDAEGNLVKVHVEGQTVVREVIQQNYLLSQSQFDLNRRLDSAAESGKHLTGSYGDVAVAVANIIPTEEQLKATQDALKQSEDNLKNSLSELNLFIQGPLGEENKNYQKSLQDNRDEVAKWQTKIDELNGKPYLTEAQKQDLAEAKGKVDELIGQQEELALAHEDATRRILFDMLQQQLALDGTSQKDLDLQMQVAKDWGLIDQDTYDAWQKLSIYTQEWNTVGGSVDKTAAKIAGIPAEKSVHVIVTEDRYVITHQGSGGHPDTTPVAAGGADFIVPSGYDGDTYPVLAQTGERVIIIPREDVNQPAAANPPAGGGSNTSELAAALFALANRPMVDERKFARYLTQSMNKANG